MRQPLTQTNAVRNRAPRRPILRWSRMSGVGLLWALSAPAFAFFQETPAPVTPVAHPLIHKTTVPSAALRQATEVLVSRNAPGVVVEGHGMVRAQSSQAHRIPLQDAMTLLLPPGWRYEPIGGAADVNPPVSWRGVAPWTARLGQIGRTEDLRFVVNWPHKTVTARIATPKPVVVVMPMQPAPLPGRIPQTPKPAPVPHWTMPAGIPLPTTLKVWAHKAHWTVLWQGHSWVPGQTLTISGDFLHAVRQLFKDIGHRGGLGYMRADVYADHVLVIRAQAPRRHHDGA